MNAVRCVVKKQGEPASIAGVEPTLETIQAIVEGHFRPLVLGADGEFRYAILCNENGEPLGLPTNVLLDNGIPIRGSFLVAKLDPNGDLHSLTEAEAAFFRRMLDEAPTARAVETAETAPSEIDDSHLVVLVPSLEDLRRAIPVPHEIVPTSNHQVYGSALLVLDAQGHDYEVINEADMKLRIAGEEKLLRVLRVNARDGKLLEIGDDDD